MSAVFSKKGLEAFILEAIAKAAERRVEEVATREFVADVVRKRAQIFTEEEVMERTQTKSKKNALAWLRLRGIPTVKVGKGWGVDAEEFRAGVLRHSAQVPDEAAKGGTMIGGTIL